MNKEDLATLLAVAELCSKNGLISLDAFQRVGLAVWKLKGAIAAMGETDTLGIIRSNATEEKPSESGENFYDIDSDEDPVQASLRRNKKKE